ncbi:SGNH/GDSL hydrolase family protein [Planctomycetaceae bacterium SH139]
MQRRNFLATATAASTALWWEASRTQAAETRQLSQGEVILFQGDSITDAGRDRKAGSANKGLGKGYPQHIASALQAEHSQLELKIYNRGISGNKVPDLDRRWQADCIDLKPSILSILIGVNDIWHKLNGKYDGTAETYRDGFAALLQQTRKALPEVTLVICEPFVLMSGTVKANESKWFPDFAIRRGYAKTVAEQADAIWVPFQTMFDAAVAAGTDPSTLAGDGVHPTQSGHALMAKTWLETVGINTAG